MQQQSRIRLLIVALFIVPGVILFSSFDSRPVTRPVHSILPDSGIAADSTREPAVSDYSNSYGSFSENKRLVYDSLNLESLGLSRKVFDYGLMGMEKLRKKGLIKTNILSIVDMSKASDEKRLFVIDLDNFQLLFNTLVAHGCNSGKKQAQYFSNQPRSRKTSLGFYVTGDTYEGSNGYSLKLLGMENGINNNAYKRAIVVHGADYVNEDYVQQQGYIGRSYGCPAVPANISDDIIDHIKEGTCLFIYSPQNYYLRHSSFLR